MSTLQEIEAAGPILSARELAELEDFVRAERQKHKVAWPDFEARRNRIFPKGLPPGKPLSEIVSEARGGILKMGAGVYVDKALSDFASDIEAGRYERPAYDLAAVFHMAEKLSSSHASQTKCRSLDVLHVAAALEIGSNEFASFDERQRSMARVVNLVVLPL